MTRLFHHFLFHGLWWALAPWMLLVGSTGSSYDPLEIDTSSPIVRVDLEVRDNERERTIPIRVIMPAGAQNLPVVLFSHGLGGSRANNMFLADHWARRGYVAVFLQHPGSDQDLWRNTPPGQRMATLQAAANSRQAILRYRDVPAVLNQLERWNMSRDHLLEGAFRSGPVGMSGYSFGAHTTQGVSGQTFPIGSFREPRVAAAILFSPTLPESPNNPERFLSEVDIPWLILTGTEDHSPIGRTTPEARMAVFPALPPDDKYEVVFYGARHSAFGDHQLPGDRGRRNPNHHRVMLALTTAFWDAYILEHNEALKWLQGEGPSSLLEPNDRWQTK